VITPIVPGEMFAKVFRPSCVFAAGTSTHTRPVGLIALKQQALGGHLAPAFSGRSLTW